MPDYRCNRIPGGTVLFINACLDRRTGSQKLPQCETLHRLGFDAPCMIGHLAEIAITAPLVPAAGGRDMSSIWTFVRKPSNQKLLSWLGGGGVIAAGGIWAVATYLWPAHEPPKVECVQQGVKIGGSVSGSTVSNTASGGAATAGPCLETTKK
jgi:hypothetical protein